jgi:hypothetical protein
LPYDIIEDADGQGAEEGAEKLDSEYFTNTADDSGTFLAK